ncbi:MAG: hypothetical protein M0D54_10445 [Hyphomonadaceae bacterium JAD_PAG50586_4]|nr:MAG: hypothetical protein M0D54_10445 [Hyphomonadaceae bacterium JAD_PAG50586_4]
MDIEKAIDLVEAGTEYVLNHDSGQGLERGKKVTECGYPTGDDFRDFAQRILDHTGAQIGLEMPVLPVSFPSGEMLNKGTLQSLMDTIVDIVVKETKH